MFSEFIELRSPEKLTVMAEAASSLAIIDSSEKLADLVRQAEVLNVEKSATKSSIIDSIKS